jgi:ATP-dependent Clp protease ATP-binding subunit ClpC
VLVAAQQEARALGHGWVGTEHLLLGLLHEREGPAARVLRDLKLELDAVRPEIARIAGDREELEPGPFPLTPRVKRVLELALREALSLGDDLIEPPHLLVALGRESEGVAAQILAEHGADVAKLRGITTYAMSHLALPPQRGVASVPMEYRAVALEGDAGEWTRRLNELAGEGWELESLMPDRAVFRRPRQS